MGWILLALIGSMAAAMLAVLRVPRLLWSLAASFLMLGATGYVLQGKPELRGRPAVADAVKLPVDPAYKEMRDTMFGRFGGESIYFGISDRQLGDGDTELAANVVIGAAQYAPKNVAFWTELGNVIALRDHGMVSPTSLFAYRQAMRLAPDHPGPPFFLGWAYVRDGQLTAARPYWVRALALAPPQSSARDAIAQRLGLLDRYLAQPPPPR